MNSFILITIFALTTLAHASESVEGHGHGCAIMGGEGSFNYDKTSFKGPSHWYDISPDFMSCGKGLMQSPINFPVEVEYGDFEEGPMPMLRNSVFNFSATSSNWALTCAEEATCGFTKFGGVNYTLFNVHFHSPSEHTLDGVRYPMETHFVHKAPDGNLAVVATLFDYPNEDDYSSKIYEGHEMDYGRNHFFEHLLDGVMKNKGQVKINPSHVIDGEKGYCTYSGSLTTPPCSEIVTWIMALNVIKVSRRQVHAYYRSAGASYDGNNRPTQAMNGRDVTCYV